MHPMLTIAVKAARRAGNLIHRAADNLDHLTVTKKSHSDYVSEVDRAAEQTIINTLLDAYPKHAILAEESGAQGDSEYLWIIDPLDGTTNFLHGFQQYAVSIALQHNGVLTQAVIYDPTKNDLFTATRGSGAYINDRRLRVSKRIELADCLIGTGFPYTKFEHLDPYMNILRDMMQKTAGLRRPGSAALDLAYTAAGRYDGFFEIGLKPWDIAAGCLLITEAGGLVGDMQGNDAYLKSGNLCAGNAKVFAQMLQVIAPHLTEGLKSDKS
ncbi:MAG: inositol monophosphatase family protein [Candidatus Nitrotoga sp.]|nr:inositol monophosphatase family protein [Candidatus Nitrotoga sp.]RFC39781.1 MAG: myo-inositol-1(or 4)-monophosphatase [Candidatus Nitrotoga sp. CP45]MDO9448344.1 inositol monophosphatase family protein [Candidatus Nitrotoga sp.]MDP1637294.1 inositol monophosphatase family protein [Candidatus Nitrotoga sp.]MDP1856741.1 inositol monophosphatase family protein [Candidatus Nitrotoga sp.]